MKPPKWDCTNAAERRRFEAWTNEQLDLLDEAEDEQLSAEDLEREASAAERDASEMLRRGLIARAAERKDSKALSRHVARRPDLAPLAFRLLGQKRQRGRRKGDPRPADLPQMIKDTLPLASADVDRIRHIWKTRHPEGRSNRTEAPTALEIAARRWNIEEWMDVLINFRKNRRRKQRPPLAA